MTEEKMDKWGRLLQDAKYLKISNWLMEWKSLEIRYILWETEAQFRLLRC